MLKETKNFPKLKKGWKKGKGDVIYEDPLYGRIQAVIHCKDDGLANYDSIIFVEPTGSGIIILVDKNISEIYLHVEKRPVVMGDNKFDIKAGNLNVKLSKLGKDSIEVPRGFIDKHDKNSLSGAVREAEEETGFKIFKKDIRKIGEINSNTSYFISNLTVYIAKVRDKATFKKLSDEESNKISNGRWYSIKEVKGMIRKNKIFCALTLAALSMAFCNLKTQK